MAFKKLEKNAEDLPFRVLNPGIADKYYELCLYSQTGEGTHNIDFFWVMRWDVGEEFFDAEVIPSAYTNLSCMAEGARVTGVTKGIYKYTVEGSGVIFGVTFKPGGIYPYVEGSVKSLTDTFIPAVELFNKMTNELNSEILLSNNLDGLEMLMNALGDNVYDPKIEMIDEIIAYACQSRKPSIANIAKKFAMSERNLQVLFETYVGVGLKWIVLRHRLQKATLIADTDSSIAWAEIAYELGYSDQSHFINDFKRIVGKTPKAYATKHEHK